MYGLPGQLTYDLYVQLSLNYRRAAARRAQSGVIAQTVSAGAMGPEEYYALDLDDPTEARRHIEEARCRAALIQSTRRRTG